MMAGRQISHQLRDDLTVFCPPLKGLSHEIFTVMFWLEWIYLDLNENR
jgi:hypothetical protein